MALRERKKQRTRDQIADVAWGLFADRGFENVTVGEVARFAEVSDATVYNYFPTKEDLFFHRLDAYGEQLMTMVADRPDGETVVQAFRRLLTQPGGLVSQVKSGDRQALRRLETVNRVIAESPRLRAREERSMSRTASLLADLLIAESGEDDALHQVDAMVVANALIGVQRALTDAVRSAVLNQRVSPRLADEVAHLAAHAFAILEDGLRRRDASMIQARMQRRSHGN